MIGIDADKRQPARPGWRRGSGRARAMSTTPHAKRPLEEKELRPLGGDRRGRPGKSWLRLSMVTLVVHDRESDFYANWAPLAGRQRPSADAADERSCGGQRRHGPQSLERHLPVGRPGPSIELRERADRPARTAHLSLRFGSDGAPRGPGTPSKKACPPPSRCNVVQVVEPNPPKNAEPVHWILLTTHAVRDPRAKPGGSSSGIRRRWIIEQFFRILKQQGLQHRGQPA